MRTRILAILIALTLALTGVSPVAAFADEAAADVASGAGSETGDAAEAADAASASGTVDVEGVAVSYEKNGATIEGCAFALDDFARLQVGSNRPIDGVYRGYAYYLGGAGGTLQMVAADDFAVLYVPEQLAAQVGLDMGAEGDQEQLRSLVKALDDANAGGGRVVPERATWYFITSQSFVRDGVMFLFDQELSEGMFYACVVGADGTDVTDSENAVYLKPNHACYASLVAAEDARIAEEPSFAEKAYAFFTSINYSPLWVTLKTSFVAIVFIFVLGLAAAYQCLHVSPRWRDILDTLFTIPMVLPPTVCGFLLLLLLGSNTAFGRFFIAHGFPLIFSWPATVIAAVVVAFPLMYRNARGAFENLDPNMMDAARTLGWSELKIFFKLMLPLSWSSIAAATVLAFARALGEFGATLFLAGNYLGVTRTIPIAIYFEWMNGNTDIALFWTVVILVFSFLVILFINLWSQHTTRYRKGANGR